MSVLINLNGDTSFDTEPTARSLLHGAVQFKPSTGEGRIVKSDGTTQALQNPPTRPKNSQLSGLTLDGEQTLWQNAAFEPNVTRTAPDSFTGNAVASHRLFDDSDRGWWIVVERSGLELIIWLHRPITIFLYRVQPFTPDIELARISLPAGLSDEPLHFHANPRGNQMVVQIISDRSGLPAGQYEGAAAERYSIRWAQFVKVINFTGTGSWPETAAEPDWGVGISAQVDDYTSPYSAGTSSLVAERIGRKQVGTANYSGGVIEASADGTPFLYGDPDDQYYHNQNVTSTSEFKYEDTTEKGFIKAIDFHRNEQLSVPVLLFFDADDQLCEFSADFQIINNHESDMSGGHVSVGGQALHLNGANYYFESYLVSTTHTVTSHRLADYRCAIKMNGVIYYDFQYRYSLNYTARAVIINGLIKYESNDVPEIIYRVNGQDRVASNNRGQGFSYARSPFFDLRPDKHSLVIIQAFFSYTTSQPRYDNVYINNIDIVGLNRNPAFNDLKTPWYGVKLYYAVDHLGIVTGLPFTTLQPKTAEGTHAYDASQFVVSYIVHPKGDKAISYSGGQTYIAYSFVYDYSNNQSWMGVGWV